MPRQKNTRPTSIYWLIDIRPETIATGWLQGLPFYCGKTVAKPQRRLRGHFSDAKRYPYKPVARRLHACGEQIRITVLETVASDKDWEARERHWIKFSRRLFPEVMTNVSDGGGGAPGFIQSAETVAKKNASRIGKPLSPAHRAKISAANTGRTTSRAAREKISAANTGKIRSQEFRIKRSAQIKELWQSEEYRDKVIRSRTGRKASDAHRASIKAGLNRPETRALRSAIASKRRHSPETLKTMCLAQRARRAAEAARNA